VRNKTGLEQVLATVERIMINEALRQSDGDQAVAADCLGLTTDELAKRLIALPKHEGNRL